jgi:hypothetical protein
MHRLGFKYMTKSPAILAPEKGTANTAAIAVLGGFALVQLIVVLCSIWPAVVPVENLQKAFSRPGVSPLATPAATIAVPEVLPQASPTNKLTIPSLPGGMAMPRGGQPSLPTAGAKTFSNPLPPSAASPVPPLPSSVLPNATLPTLPLPVAVAPSTPLPTLPKSGVSAPLSAPTSPPASRTGNPQLDELVDTAQQLRELQQYSGAVEALERADLIAPDNAIVLRELMVTYQLLGQTDKAKAIRDRIQQLRGNGSAETAIPSMSADAMRALASRDSAAAKTTADGPLRLGEIEVLHDATMLKGQRLALRVPLIAAPGQVIDHNQWRLDVFFYDQVKGVPAYPSIANPPVTTDDGACDFKQGGQEVVKVIYELPELSPADVAEFGQRTYLGYVVKLYYQNKLMSQAADPVTLFNYRAPGSSTAR